METNGKAAKTSGEISMTENKKAPSDVIINIHEKDSKLPNLEASKDHKSKLSADSPRRISNDSPYSPQNAGPMSCSSPDVGFTPRANRPPKIPTETIARRKSLSRSLYSKPKSRFGEQSVPLDANMFEENGSSTQERVVSSRGSPIGKIDANSTGTKENIRTLSITPKTPLMSSPGGFRGVDEDEEIYNRVNSRKKLKYRKVKAKVLIEWLLFLCIVGCLIASLTVDELQHWRVWGLGIWKWCVLVLVTFNGMMVTDWLIHFVVLLIELNFLLKRKVLYFVYGLKKSVRVCIWLSLVLVTWVLLFQEGVGGTRLTTKILHYITWTIASLLIGAFLWLLKTLLLKILASSFHVNSFFDRIQESIFHQYILFTLSGPPVMESAQMLGKTNSNVSQFSFRVMKKGKEGKEKKEKEVIDINKLHQMKQEKVSAWTMKMLVEVISNSGLTTLSSAIDETVYDGGNEQADKEITNEEEAIAAAYHIFRNVAQPGSNYIDELDLRRFMIKEEVDFVFSMIETAETWQIDRKALTEWVVKVYKGRKALAHALNDTKTAIKQLNKLVTLILLVVILIVWLLLAGIATTKVLVFLSSQLVLAVFIFGNSCKTVFEAIIFVFVMHPFDVGDRCVIDGVQMIVEEMNILTTVFLRFDNEKIYYPNSILATKPISNFFRSPDMGDSLEFCIDFKTPLAKIGALKEKIKKYLEKNPQHWHPNHNVVVKEIENVNKIKMALFFNHTINFQDYGEKNRRKTDLVLELKNFFEELHIGYDLLPQEVRLVESSAVSAGISR
ncbi:Mechanosensitive ion channel protein 10 [Abeliophyllum distichum]|uniref:Mechanosensitive ion channel protein n=1 Tax=Abeliophyllum distichum TaxID=126358 RepID=A0ABD1RIX4_9LAMI